MLDNEFTLSDLVQDRCLEIREGGAPARQDHEETLAGWLLNRLRVVVDEVLNDKLLQDCRITRQKGIDPAPGDLFVLFC